MVTLENYVDGDVPRWNLGDDEPLGVDVHAVVVFHPDIAQRTFERAVLALEKRKIRRLDLTLKHARQTGTHLKVIDADSISEAEEACVRRFGYDYLDRFINDTIEVAAEEVGRAAARSRGRGVSVSPERVINAISVTPTRSFADRNALLAWEAGKPASWRPSARLEVRLSLDGPLAAVEASSEDIRRAIAVCGPLTFFEEHARSTSEAPDIPQLALMSCGEEPEACA